MSNCYLVNATTINAYWWHGFLFLTASGQAECPEYVSISQSPMRIFPPEYQIMTCACPQVGSFPYDVHAWFELGEQQETVTVHTASGPQKVEVEPFPPDLREGLPTPSLLTAEPADGEVVGIAPNSLDFGRALADAVGKLHKLYPGNVNAAVTETGVVAAGSPVGVAFLYVRMKQNAASATKRSATSTATKTKSSKTRSD